MKKSLLITLAIIVAVSTFASDVLTLNNGKRFEVKVKRIKGCSVIVKANGRKFEVPATDIYSIQFENVKDKVYTGYLKMLDQDPDLCLQGKLDAENYHGKRGTHFVLGVLFGPFAMIGTAIANPTPEKGRRTYILSKNKEYFDNTEYLSCYRKRAKLQLIGMEALGWGAWILFVLLVGSGQ